MIAKIVSVYNAEGYLRLVSFSDFPERFLDLESVFVDIFGDKRKFKIEYSGFIKNDLVIKFENFDSDEDAAHLLEKFVYVSEDDAVKLPEDTFYIHDLIGCKVIQNSKVIGSLIDVLRSPANDVYVIENDERKEMYVAALKSNLLGIDVKKKELTLSDDCELVSNDEN